MSTIRPWLFVAVLAATAACGKVAADEFDAGRDVIDSGPAAVDSAAAPDAAPAPPPGRAEISAGAGHVSGRIYRADVQIGHGHIEGP